MSTGQHRQDIHQFVDSLSPEEVEALHLLIRYRLPTPPSDQPQSDGLLADEPVRDLSFIGLMHADPDLAERSQEILRAEMGRREPE